MMETRLDCDWYGENTRCFAAVTRDRVEFCRLGHGRRRAYRSWDKGHGRLANSAGLSRRDYRNAS